jgi:drug/metabolite transporter (DMT)-like permease
VLAILGGLVAALMWGTATVSSSRASRIAGASSTLAGVMLVGFVVAVPIAAFAGVPADLGARDLGWLAVSGVGNVLGLLLEYAGLRIGKVGVVAAIASTEGALTAVLAIAFGERVTLATAVLLAVIAGGVVLASIAPGDAAEVRDRRVGLAALYGLGAAVAFAISLYATAHVGRVVSVPWILVAARVVGVAAIAVPAAARGRLRLGRSVLPLVGLVRRVHVRLAARHRGDGGARVAVRRAVGRRGLLPLPRTAGARAVRRRRDDRRRRRRPRGRPGVSVSPHREDAVSERTSRGRCADLC